MKRTLPALLLGVFFFATACGGSSNERPDALDVPADTISEVARQDADARHDAVDPEGVGDAVDAEASEAPFDAAEVKPGDAVEEARDAAEAAEEAEPSDVEAPGDADGSDGWDQQPDHDAADADLDDDGGPHDDALDADEAVEADVGGVPVGEPCSDDGDCGDGRCVWGPAGRVCAVECQSDDDCGPDDACRNVSSGGPKVGACVLRHLGLCRPCRTDLDCLGHAYPAGVRCLARDPAEGAFCRTPCGPAVACPDGYACLSLANDPGAALCVPQGGECGCDPIAVEAQLATDCVSASPAGLCRGERACGPQGLSACDAELPTFEACNGHDDDCDGQTDEGFGVTTCGQGACFATVVECDGGAPRTCTPGAPGVEVCNAVDDDCDGATDENLGEIACGQGSCATFVPACLDGTPQACVPLSGASESCDGVDNDCDGQTDEDLGMLACGLGVCATEVAACVDGQPQPCVPLPLGGDEACDGLDDDCDGQTDEELGDLSCGQGVCARTVAACQGGVSQACVAGQPAAAEACDGVDDDCDGQTDEGFATLTCGEGACRVTVVACSGGTPAECVPLAGHPETCDGLDDDCDGQTDEGFGLVACGTGTCSNAVQSCRNGVPQTCAPLPPSSAEACNGVDDDCDTKTDEDLGLLTCGKGACVVSVDACRNGVPQACVPLPAAASEACNAIDDDCDGLTDEDLGLLTCGNGVCATAVVACKAGVPQTCVPLPAASTDVCNLKDDDCDGLTDEDLGKLSCGKGACSTTVDACRNGLSQTCAPLPVATPETCNLVDDDCDGATDEDLGTVSCGLGACATTAAACAGGVVPTCTPNWAAQGQEVCNAVDDDCDGQVDEGMGGSWCVRYGAIDGASPALGDAALVAALHALVTDGSVAYPYTGSNNARLKMYGAANGIEADANGVVQCIYTARTATIPAGATTNYSVLGTCVLPDGNVCTSCDVAPTEAKCGFNTEHAWPRSHLKVALLDGSAEYLKAEGDMHHLFPSWYQANSHRSDNLYGETDCVPADGSCNWPDLYEGYEPSQLGDPSSPGYPDDLVFDVRPERRGDVARAWFYMSVRYQMAIADYVEAVLRAWHQADPPDQRELTRNAGVDAFQNNRNPFVDRPNYVDRIGDF